MLKQKYITVLLLYSFLLCGCSFAFSPHKSNNVFFFLKNQSSSRFVPQVCFITPKRKSFLQVASPASSNLSEDKQERKRRLHKLKDSFKKYLITKPRSLFRKQEKNSLRNQSQVVPTTDSANHNNSIVNTIDATTVETESVSTNNIAETESTMKNEIPELISDMIVSSDQRSIVTTTTEEDEEGVTHERWAYSHKDVDFTGVWKIVTSDTFKNEYDIYLSRLGQPALVRSVAINIVDFTAEDVIHNGLELTIRGKNLRGSWDRTLITSGYNHETGDVVEQVENLVSTADRLETIQAESWWEEQGTVHVSWMKGVKRYGGGSFESRRYLEDNGNILICESTFHPESNTNMMKHTEKATIRWKFQRND